MAFSGVTVERILEAVYEEQARLDRWRIGSGPGRIALLAALIVTLGCLAIHARALYPVLGAMPATWIAVMQSIRGSRGTFERGMAVAISYFDDVRLIGPTLEMYYNQAETEMLLAPILERLFSRFTESDAHTINGKQCKILYRELERSCLYFHSDPKMLCGGINAIASIGDRSAVPLLEKLQRSAKDRSVREAARKVLPIVLGRLKAGSIRASLLRPADGVRPDENLLHPARCSTDGANALLRATEVAAGDEV